MFFFAFLLWGVLVRLSAADGSRDARFMLCTAECQFKCQPPVYRLLQDGSVDPRDLTRHADVISTVRSEPGLYAPPNFYDQLHLALEAALTDLLRGDRSRLVDADDSRVDASGFPLATPQQDLGKVLRLTGWGCEDNCGYQCMHINHRLRVENGEPVVKYGGKWAFTRVFGMQELMSVVSSLLNALPHVIFLYQCYGSKTVPLEEYRFGRVWTLYACIGIIVWIASATFHTRDWPATEAFDYMSALMGVSTALMTGLVYNLAGPKGDKALRAWLPAIPVYLFIMAHQYYMLFIDFNYGWNMKVACSVGAVMVISWCYWAFTHRRRGKYVRWIYVATLGIAPLLYAFELNDFPPYFLVLDAHACWHFTTVPLQFVWYHFVEDDLLWEMRHRVSAKYDEDAEEAKLEAGDERGSSARRRV
ncbi:Post-GPI attachment to proteins factor 3 [Perkinsus olseni]|uniref:Post-GPI attachment to proteins factor 3 n=1 Tax=Perkinsus olseni TaxID=32597 RepID=A0A7J6LFI9_PEROL|nr:Post-GPI attachment to proteins factor 3 [Perkinsus olseni]